jgi:hypothetical protein
MIAVLDPDNSQEAAVITVNARPKYLRMKNDDDPNDNL